MMKHVGCVGQKRNEHKILVGKPEGKKQLMRCYRGWEVNIRMFLNRIRCDIVNYFL